MSGVALTAAPGAPARGSAAVVQTRAASIDTALLHALRGEGGFSGRVHSVFDRVVNIENQVGEMFTLACRGMDNAPNTAILRLAGFGACGIAGGDAVRGDAQGIRLGERLHVQLADASPWECSLAAYPSEGGGRLRINLRWLQAELDRLDAAGGMLAPPRGGSAFELAVADMLAQRSTQLADALARGDHAAAREHACSLFGLGPGLTPSGDDFLVGLFAVLNISGSPCRGWLGGGTEVLACAQQATHAISLAALVQAARGRVRESIASLIGHLMYGAPGHLAPALRRVLAIGSTSGADIVAGVRCGLELNITHEGKRSCQSRW
ncbi:MAG: DUF2877 domain-containing protein [Proteobacteria bacterium]|nr:DUF2877 domain-containing protein [Pseudomonadota bacterium]